MVRLFLILVLLALSAPGITAADAKEIKGTPKILIGTFGHSAGHCRAWHRNRANIVKFFKDSYSDCDGKICTAGISHKLTRNGFILRYDYYTWVTRTNIFQTVTKIDNDTFATRGPGKDRATLVRCKEKDVVAGIGIDPEGLYDDEDNGVLFSVYYGLAIPAACNDVEARTTDRKFFEADVKLAEKLVSAAIPGIIKSWQRSPEAYRALLADTDKGIKHRLYFRRQDAEKALQIDENRIEKFCDEAMKAYGPDGKAVPNLLRIVDHNSSRDERSGVLNPETPSLPWPNP